MCRICLGQGSHDIFENDSLNSDSCDPGRPERIAEKLRYVTLLKVWSPTRFNLITIFQSNNEKFRREHPYYYNLSHSLLHYLPYLHIPVVVAYSLTRISIAYTGQERS